MTNARGHRPTTEPRQRSAQDAFMTAPFARLARTHALSTASDAMVATALAGTIFFEGATSEARGKVLLYLLLTMAPFALLSPLIGPVIDRARSGRRWMVIGSTVGRSLICFLMIRDVDNLLFYPEALALLVLQKSYVVARSALVPATVDSDEGLVEANSKLSLISGLMGFVGAAPAALLFRLFGPEGALSLAMVGFAVASLAAFRLPKEAIADAPPDEAEKVELRGVGVLLAASGMGVLRGVVGFLTLLLAFDFRTGNAPKWHFAVVAGLSVAGSLVGALMAPRLRRIASEERMLIGVLVSVSIAAGLAVLVGGWVGAALLGATVGMGSVSGKMAFDSIVQRDAPDANRGRSFARFETRFQVIWVFGALLGLIPMAARLGFAVVMVVVAFSAFTYVVGSLAWRHRSGATRTPVSEKAVVVDERMSEVQAAAKRGLARTAASLRRRARKQLPTEAAPEVEAGEPSPARPQADQVDVPTRPLDP